MDKKYFKYINSYLRLGISFIKKFLLTALFRVIFFLIIPLLILFLRVFIGLSEDITLLLSGIIFIVLFELLYWKNKKFKIYWLYYKELGDKTL